MRSKLERSWVKISTAEVLPDVQHKISRAVKEDMARTHLVLVPGETSVDPDDVTAQASEEAGGGVSIQPGNNMTIGYKAFLTVAELSMASYSLTTQQHHVAHSS